MSRKLATPRLTRAQKAQQARIEQLELLNPSHAPYQTPRLEAKNQNQKKAKALLESNTPVVMLMGSAGTGKSLLAAWRIATVVNTRKAKVYLARPAVQVGKSIGLLPGTVEEKLAPYFAQTLSHIEKFLKPGSLKAALADKSIEMVPVEYLRGRSFENCIVVVEEAQNLTYKEMEMMVTRLGDSCQMIFTGDTKQNDLRSESGLRATLDKINDTLDHPPEGMTEEDLDALDFGVGVVEFTPEDVIRSGLTKAFVSMYYFSSEGDF